VTIFKPNLKTLPEAQARLWAELSCIPAHFVLYGGTAVALRFGHRPSIDFDFFSSQEFRPDELASSLPLLSGAETLQSKLNTLTVSVSRGAPVRLSFFGGLTIGRADDPQRADDNGIKVASLLDLAATKVSVVQQRAESKDYLDLVELIRSGTTLENAIGAAIALYGESFNPAITLKALAYFKDGDLAKLPKDTQQFLATKAARIGKIPLIMRRSDEIG